MADGVPPVQATLESQVEVALGLQPKAQGQLGDAASPQSLNRLTRSLAGRSLKARAGAGKKITALLKTAVAQMRAGDFIVAAQSALQALKLDERNFLAWHVLAIAQEKAGQFGPALTAYEAALKLAPRETDIARDLARLADRLGQTEIAEKLLLIYLAEHPGHVEATNNLACAYRDQRRYGEAIDLLKPLLTQDGSKAVLWNTLGTVMTDQGETSQAMVFFEEALRLQPTFAKARYNRGNARQVLGDREGALEDLEAAQAGADHGYETAMMAMAKAMHLMGMGRLAEGYATYEARLDPNLPDAPLVVTRARRWRPGDAELEGASLLVVGEQGLADELLFGSVLPDLQRAMGPEGTLYVAVERRLVDMYARALPGAVVGAHKAVRHQGRLHRLMPFMEPIENSETPPTYWTPVGSLMAVFRPELSAFPTTPGYLTPAPDKVARWKTELAGLGDGLKVGLHWKSLVMKGNRARYFSSFERWRPVLTAPGCRMVNLQCGDTEDDLAEARAAGVEIWTPPIDLKDDLEDVAALSLALDLVIGPGVAGTNLAAACGARTWMIHAPDDWHRLGTEAYPFYPGMRFIPLEGFDGWPGALATVRADLDAAVARGGF